MRLPLLSKAAVFALGSTAEERLLQQLIYLSGLEITYLSCFNSSVSIISSFHKMEVALSFVYNRHILKKHNTVNVNWQVLATFV